MSVRQHSQNTLYSCCVIIIYGLSGGEGKLEGWYSDVGDRVYVRYYTGKVVDGEAARERVYCSRTRGGRMIVPGPPKGRERLLPDERRL